MQLIQNFNNFLTDPGSLGGSQNDLLVRSQQGLHDLVDPNNSDVTLGKLAGGIAHAPKQMIASVAGLVSSTAGRASSILSSPLRYGAFVTIKDPNRGRFKNLARYFDVSGFQQFNQQCDQAREVRSRFKQLKPTQKKALLKETEPGKMIRKIKNRKLWNIMITIIDAVPGTILADLPSWGADVAKFFPGDFGDLTPDVHPVIAIGTEAFEFFQLGGLPTPTHGIETLLQMRHDFPRLVTAWIQIGEEMTRRGYDTSATTADTQPTQGTPPTGQGVAPTPASPENAEELPLAA